MPPLALLLAVALPSVSSVQAQLVKDGPLATVRALDADGRWDAILDRIGVGDPRWIALAPGLAPGADAGTAEGLGIALATGLPRAPAAVLAVLSPQGPGSLAPDRVCSAPFIEDTAAHQHSYKAQALAAVATVTAPGLATMASACKAQLLKVR